MDKIKLRVKNFGYAMTVNMTIMCIDILDETTGFIKKLWYTSF